MIPYKKVLNSLCWVPSYLAQRWSRRRDKTAGFVHLVLAVADHFEPAILPGQGAKRAPRDVQRQRLERWCHQIPKVLGDWRDADGVPFRHTYFYPAEQYDPEIIERLARHCLDGWGDIEIHLHHGSDRPDTPENTRQMLVTFRDILASHGCLSRLRGERDPCYAFVHGNFALANSNNNHNCGVDAEIKILSETGCFADFTLPSAPHPTQVSKINALYECGLPLGERAPHRRGKDLRVGQRPKIFPLIVQGPLMWDFSWGRRGLLHPVIENSELTTLHPPSLGRLELWRQAAISVLGRPDWVFVKLHCHGMDPRDEDAMFGERMKNFLSVLVEGAKTSGNYQIHFTTAREMVNIILAACDGKSGNPGDYRDYRYLPIRGSKVPERTQKVSSPTNQPRY